MLEKTARPGQLFIKPRSDQPVVVRLVARRDDALGKPGVREQGSDSLLTSSTDAVRPRTAWAEVAAVFTLQLTQLGLLVRR
jgi:hypothetical protein